MSFHYSGSRLSGIGIRNREQALALLRRLHSQSQAGLLSGVQQQIIDDVNDILSLEIDFISNPQHWGGLTTLMYLWAALLGSDNPPTAPIHLVIRVGMKIEIMVLHPDGTVTEANQLPEAGNVLVYDGGTHWMWAGHYTDLAPLNMEGVVEETSFSSNDEDSGFNSPSNSLVSMIGKTEKLLENAMHFLLIHTMEKILNPSVMSVK